MESDRCDRLDVVAFDELEREMTLLDLVDGAGPDFPELVDRRGAGPDFPELVDRLLAEGVFSFSSGGAGVGASPLFL